MDYVIDLESYSLVFRPREMDSEVIQCQRTEYSREVADPLYKDLLATSSGDADWHQSAVFAFLVLMSGDLSLVATNEEGEARWLVQAGGISYDFGERVESAVVIAPTPLSFDLILRLQPSAYRFEVDELITLDNFRDTEFVQQKQAMDYLYQRGVFGKFDD